MMHRLLLFLFLLCSTFAFAQQPRSILSNEDTTAMRDAMNPSSMQVNPEDDQAVKDSLTKAGYALKRLKDVISMKKNTLWSTELSRTIRDFQDSTYILVSPLMRVQGRGVLIGLVSQLGEINLFDPTDPYVNLYWVINPVRELEEPFKLTFHLEHSAMLHDSLFAASAIAIQRHYANKVYQNVAETQEDIIAATTEFLALLQAEVGDTYAPKYVFKVGGRELGNNFQLDYTQVQKPAGSELVIDLIERKTGLPATSPVTWTGARGADFRSVFIFPDSIGLYTITCKKDSFEMQLKINLQGPINFTAILENTYKSILKEVIMQLIVSLNDKMDEKDSLKVIAKRNLFEVAEVVNTNALAVTTTSAGSQTPDYYSIDFNDIALSPDSELQTAINAEAHILQIKSFQLKYTVLREAIDFLVVHKEVVAEFLEPGNLRALGDQIGDDLGTLSANILVELMQGGDEAMRKYLFGYLLEKSTEIAQERQ